MPTRDRSLKGWQRCMAALTTAVVLLAMPGLLPVMITLLAEVDQEHRVSVSGNGDEALVILKHDASCPAMVSQHRHCPMSRALVFFAQSTEADADHVLHFSGGGKYLRNHPLSIPTPDTLAVVPVVAAIKMATTAVSPRHVCFPDNPAPPGARQSFRTALLLI